MAAFDFPSSPSVNQTYTANGVTWKWNGTMWLRITGAGYLEKIEEGNSKVEVDDSGSGNVTVTTDGTERLRVTSAGRIGVNKTSPFSDLQVITAGQTEDGTFRIGGSQASLGLVLDYDQSSATVSRITANPTYTNTSSLLKICVDGDANSDQLVLKGDGKVGINQASPEAMLQVDYDEGSSEVGLRLRAYNASGSKTWQLSEINGNAGVFSIRNVTNSTAGLDIHGDGHVRVPTGDLRVGDNTDSNAGTQTISVGSVSSGSGGIGIFANPTNGNSFVQFGDGTSSADQYRGYMNYRHADDSLRFGTANTDRLLIDSSGRVTKPNQPLAIIGTTQNNWSPSAGDVLPFNYSNTNRGNHYNTSNYTFTCPVSGDYMVILRLSRKGWCGDLELAKNNSQYVRLELRETGRNNSSAADWQAWCYDFIVPCAANDTLKWKAPSVNTGTGGGNYLLDGYNHIYYDSVTYYLMG